MKVDFLTTLDCRFFNGIQWQLVAPFVAVVDADTDGQRIIRVPAGFLTDFASIGRWPVIYLQFANRVHRQCVVHDWQYSVGGTQADKDYADQVFLQGMMNRSLEEAEAMTPQEARTMFDGVHTFGAKHFHYIPALPPLPSLPPTDHP